MFVLYCIEPIDANMVADYMAGCNFVDFQVE